MNSVLLLILTTLLYEIQGYGLFLQRFSTQDLPNQLLDFIRNSQQISQNQFSQPNEIKLRFIRQQLFRGKYQTENQKIFDYLSSKSGSIFIYLYKNPFNNTGQQIDLAQVYLFDPQYMDQKLIQIRIPLSRHQNYQWVEYSSTVRIMQMEKLKQNRIYNISKVQFNITLQNVQSGILDLIKIHIAMNSSQIQSSFRFSGSMSYKNTIISTMGYSLFVCFIVIAQIVSAYVIVKKIQVGNANLMHKLSLCTLTICNIQDFYLTMTHIQYLLTRRQNGFFMYLLPTVFYIALYAAFDIRLLFVAWKSHYLRNINGDPRAVRRKLMCFYLLFYLALFLYLTMAYFFSYDSWMIILQNLIMVPQIIHNIKSGVNPGFQSAYIFGYLGTRLLLPLYQRSCPNNHFMLVPIMSLAITLVFMYTLQILILYLQYKGGPRFCIPRSFQPNYFDYSYTIKSTQETKEMECSICLQSYFVDPMNMNATQYQQAMVKQKKIMKTPCNHLFHKQCLTNWADVKLECPACKAVLPPL